MYGDKAWIAERIAYCERELARLRSIPASELIMRAWEKVLEREPDPRDWSELHINVPLYERVVDEMSYELDGKPEELKGLRGEIGTVWGFRLIVAEEVTMPYILNPKNGDSQRL